MYYFFPGKAQTAAVKRDAEIGVAQANRDAGIREAECEKAAMDVKYNTGMITEKLFFFLQNSVIVVGHFGSSYTP